MELHATRFAHVMNLAIELADPLLDQFEEKMGEQMTEESFVEFLHAMSLFLRMTAIRTRVTTCASRSEDAIQTIKEDHMKRGIALGYYQRAGLLDAITKENPKAMAFLKETSFLEYPEELMKTWRTDVNVVNDGRTPSDLPQ